MLALLIRHALVEAQDRIGRRPDLPLSQEGEEQARQLAERLQTWDIAAVFSSPLVRTLRTAQVLAESRGIPVQTDTCLNEIDFGEWDNRSFKSLEPLESWKAFNTFRSSTRCPGGEMMIEVQSRVVGLLERVIPSYPDATIAIVSHADVIRSAVCHYLGVPLDLSLRIQISPASLTVLRLDNCGAELLRLNDVEE